MPPKVTIVTVWRVPKEAREIAEKFRQSARKARALAQTLRKSAGILDSSWEGNSKNNFMGEFKGEPSKLESYADWLDSKAREIENIKVAFKEKKVG